MTSVADVPGFDREEAAAIARELFGVDGAAVALPSERDQNWRIDTVGGQRWVLKVANAHESWAMLDAEVAAMQRLAPLRLCPVPAVALAGGAIGAWGPHLVRLVSHLPGVTLATHRWRPPALLESVGEAVGRMDAALAGFDHPALHREFHWDLDRAVPVVSERLHLVADTRMRAVIERLLERHGSEVEPRLADARVGVVHGDANDHNVLVDERGGHVTGVVDLGDMMHSHVVHDVAIAMAYTALGQRNPLGAAAHVLRGYQRVHPLSEDEVAMLPLLVCLRLATSVCLAASQSVLRDDPYLVVSQVPVARTLPELAAVHPRLAHAVLRGACGWEPVAASAQVRAWLGRHRDDIAPLLDAELDLRTAPVLGLDMSAGSPLVASDPSRNGAAELGARIDALLAEAGARVGVGGYLEPRVIYEADPGNLGALSGVEARVAERRTVHLGIDVSAPPGTALHAPLDGVVHGFEEAAAFHDYGPVIVLRHEVPEDRGGNGGGDGGGGEGGPIVFHTLYGHLSRESLDALEVGAPVARGQRFATIGAPPFNGDWWPHTHVQLIVDMLDVACNANGVASASERAVWSSLCPDPNLLLGVPDGVMPTPLDPAHVSARRAARTGGNLSISYRPEPLTIVRGWRQHLYDHEGRSYLDAYNNVAHVGHSHPRVVEAVARQLSLLNTNTRYLQPQLTEYADELIALFPDPLSVCWFTASGSEANELALRLTRAHTGRRDLLVMDAAYHGHTTTLIDISPYKHDGPGGKGAPAWVHTTVIPDAYRRGIPAAASGPMFAAEVGEVVDRLVATGTPPSAYIAESCPSVAGQILLPDGFLAEVYRRVRAVGGLCIADEVQTGFGRLGTHRWAFEAHGVVPDVVVLGKPIANGYPMGAVVTTREIAASFDDGMEFFSTFGGSTAACAAARATLQVVRDEGLQEHADAVGNGVLLPGLQGLVARHEVIGDVRGSGLFVGIELVADRAARTPAPDAAAWVVQRMRHLGVLAGTDGPAHNVIKLRGPLPLSAADAQCIVDVLDIALTELPPPLRSS